uniref:Uncharacterized protein n=1 Tax=Anopheles christyi TaxID=43041 RepID=A0A182JY81_9DIPT
FNVGSPHPQVPTARFTFSETSASRQSVGVVPTSGGVAGTVGLPEGIDDTRIDLSQLDEATAGGSSSGSGRSVPTTPQHTTHSSDHIIMGGLAAAAAGPTSSGLNNNDRLSSGGGESQVPDILVSGANIGESTTSSSIDPLHVSYSSEAQASTDAGSGALERSERELLEEDDDLVDGGDSRSIGAEANATIGADDVDDDDVDGDVDMEDHSSSTTNASTSAGKPKFGGPSSAAGSETNTAAPSTSASAESPAAGSSSAGTSQASDSASGSGLSSAARKNEADAGAGDDGVSSEGEHLNKNLTQSPMEESSEADVLETPSSNTRSRSSTSHRVATNVTGRRGGRRFNQRGANRTPITWNEG